MDKIWIVYNKGSYKKKYKIYKTEAELTKDELRDLKLKKLISNK